MLYYLRLLYSLAEYTSPVATVEFGEVVRLQQHIVELQEGQRLLTFQPQANTIVRHHAVDREMRAVLSQKVEIRQLVQPLVVIDELGVRRAVPERQELGKNAGESVNIPLQSRGQPSSHGRNKSRVIGRYFQQQVAFRDKIGGQKTSRFVQSNAYALGSLP